MRRSRAFRNRPLDTGPYPIVSGGCPCGHGARGWQDRQRPRARRHRGECAKGTARSSASELPPAKDKAGWLAPWRSLAARGLLRGGARDLEMPTRGLSMRSARPGSPGSACRTHDLAGSPGQGGQVPAALEWRPWCAPSSTSPTLPRSQLEFQRVTEALAGKLPEAAEHLEQAREDLLALPHFRERALAPDLEHQPSRSACTRRSAGVPTW
jgi:putative transposase